MSDNYDIKKQLIHFVLFKPEVHLFGENALNLICIVHRTLTSYSYYYLFIYYYYLSVLFLLKTIFPIIKSSIQCCFNGVCLLGIH